MVGRQEDGGEMRWVMNNPMSNLTTKQRNFYIFCGVIVVLWFVVRFMNNAAQQAAFYREQAVRAQQQRAKANTPPPAPKAPKQDKLPPRVVLTDLSNLSGTWFGQRLMSQNGMCTLRLEMRPVPQKPEDYKGYARLNCMPPAGLTSLRGGRVLPKQQRDNLNPVAMVLTGVPEDGAMHFTLDKTVVAPNDDCETTEFNVTPFGTNQVAVEWREGKCRGTQLILNKNGR
jgi:hypothetical protein